MKEDSALSLSTLGISSSTNDHPAYPSFNSYPVTYGQTLNCNCFFINPIDWILQGNKFYIQLCLLSWYSKGKRSPEDDLGTIKSLDRSFKAWKYSRELLKYRMQKAAGIAWDDDKKIKTKSRWCISDEIFSSNS